MILGKNVKRDLYFPVLALNYLIEKKVTSRTHNHCAVRKCIICKTGCKFKMMAIFDIEGLSTIFFSFKNFETPGESLHQSDDRNWCQNIFLQNDASKKKYKI
jgi:hypothetical protein